MLNFRKVAADGDGEKIRRYLTQETPEAEPSVAIDPAGRLLEPGERLTAYYTGRDERASWRPDMPQLLSRALGIDAEQRSIGCSKPAAPTMVRLGPSTHAKTVGSISSFRPTNP